MASSPDKPLIERLKERKLVQWALAYIAGGWVILQVLDVIADPFGVPVGAIRVAFGALVVGFFVTLVLAWYHGEQGRQRVSGPELLIIAGLLVVAGIGFRVLFSGDQGTEEQIATPSAAVPEASIAVLPFDDLSQEGDQQYFVEGLSEEIINALSQIADLKVSARTSTFLLAEEGTDIGTIASTLGVANVLEGSVRKSGERVRIQAQLIEAGTESNLWSETFERELTDIFAIQDEIARAITDQLQVTLSASQQVQLVAQGTESTEAHEAYLRGRYFLEQRLEESLLSAIPEFRRAIEIDPEYASAYSGLADSNSLLQTYAPGAVGTDWRAVRERGLDLAQRAVELDPDLGMAHASLGYAQTRLGQWENAERAFERALGLSPGYATAHHWFGVLLNLTGRSDEAVVEIQRAVDLDPVSRAANRDLGGALWYAGRLDEAAEQLRRTIELAPNYLIAHENLLSLLIRTGEYDEAREVANVWARLTGTDSMATHELIDLAADYGNTGEVPSVSVPENYPITWPQFRALYYADTGQQERSLAVFEDVIHQGDHFAAAAFHGRLSQLLGDDPRYQALLEEAGITW